MLFPFFMRLVMDKGLVFYSLIDFFPKKDQIKENFEKLKLDDKIIYKMYVYSIPFEDEYIKDLIWDFLNGWEEAIFDLSKNYRQKKQKYERQRQKEKEIYGDDEYYEL